MTTKPGKSNNNDDDVNDGKQGEGTTPPSMKSSGSGNQESSNDPNLGTKEETKTPSPPRPPIPPTTLSTQTGLTPATLPSPSPSYISSASSPSPTNASSSGARPPINHANSFGVESRERNTIDSEASTTTILRKDSDDVSLSKIKPVHNFFAQQQPYGYDSDGSDGSLVFSPASFDDHKSTVLGSATKKGSVAKRKEPPSTTTSPFIVNRDRTQSTDSNSSIKYIDKSPQHASQTSMTPSSQPVNPQMLPYNERRKLMQQRQQETPQTQQQSPQMQHVQMQQHYAYQAAMMMQAQAQQQMAQNQQAGKPPQTPLHPAQMYAMDPRMAAAYYQMYGMPPPQAAMFPPPSNSPHNHPGGVPPPMGYPFPAPPPGAYNHLSPSHQPQPPTQPHQQQGSGYAQPYPNQMQYQHYPGFHMAGGQPMPPPSYGYNMPDQPPHVQFQQEQQPPQQPQQQPTAQQQSGPATNAAKQDRKAAPAPTPTHPTPSNAKNPPRPPTSAGNGKPPNPAHRNASSSGSVPPPPPPPSTSGNSHFRAESYGSMSSIGSHGAFGISSSSYSRDEDDDTQPSLPPPPPPPPPLPKPKPPPPPSQQQQDQSGAKAQPVSKQPPQTSDSKTKTASAAAPPPLPPTPPSQRQTLSEYSMLTPETPLETAHARKDSFLDRLRMNWSPQSRDSPSSVSRKKPNIQDFHRKNQEFLQRSTLVPTFSSPTPTPGMAHRRVSSQDRPPASRGTHRRLQSISNDEWDEEDKTTSGDDRKMPAKPPFSDPSNKTKPPPSASRYDYGAGEDTSDSASYFDDNRFTSDEAEDSYDEANERTSLLPPSGISTNEHDESKYGRGGRYTNQNYAAAASGRRHQRKASRGAAQMPSSSSISDSSSLMSRESDAAVATERWDNRTAQMFKKPKKKKYRRRGSKQKSINSSDDDSSSESDPFASDESFDYRKWTKDRARMLERERSKLIEQWKAEARAEAEMARKEEECNHWLRRCWRSLMAEFHKLGNELFRFSTLIEAFIGNLPLTIGAVAMAVVTLGVVWFKFVEEYLETCEPVRFHSSQCTFPEFPGCFYCDTSATGYKIAVGFHYGCNIVSGFLALLVVAKIILATRVVMDEMSSPTTSSPAGLLCMTAVCVFAGRGLVGQIVVTSAACVHLCLAIWFIYMALAYHIMPEPSWFPNTVGIGISAVKTWLYYPMPGHLLMAISLSLNFFFFPISLIRVAVNKKISATVGWMQMGAPAISLYALTIMAQPSFEEEHPDVTNFQRVHRMVYLPCMHVMCALSILGMGASIHSLYVRWPRFKTRDFSPAHAAFCFPTLSHANAIQAYRGAIKSFSDIPSGTWRMFLLDAYWFIVLMGGTIATFWICGKFIYKLPEWTSPDLSDEEQPPAPYDTLLSQQHMVTAGDALTQPFVSPAILQANETGALILTRAQDGTLRYVRTRRVKALGFEPTMKWSDMQEETEVLLDWVGKHPPRRRNRTLSVPGIDFRYGASFGTGNSGVYGSASPDRQSRRRFMSQGGDREFY